MGTTRAAVRADAEALVALEIATMGGEAWSTAQVAGELHAAAAGGRVVRVLLDDEEIVGWVDLAPGGDVADLLRLAVDPDRQRGGHGTRLLADGLRGLPGAVERVLLEVAATNDPALATYAAAGFTAIARRRGYYRDGADAVVMQLDLPAGTGRQGSTTRAAGSTTAGGAR